MSYEQLLLPFHYSDTTAEEMMSADAKNFLYGLLKNKNISTRKQALVTESENSVEAIFASRKKSYHTVGNSQSGAIYADMVKSFYDLTQPGKAVANPNLVNYGTAHMPRYIKMVVQEDKSLVVDYAFSVVRRDHNNRGAMNPEDEFFRAWIHTVYSWNKFEERHLIDKENSWIGLYSVTTSSDVYVQTYAKQSNFTNNDGLLYPWIIFTTLDMTNTAQWWVGLKNKLKNFLEQNVHVKLFQNSKELDVKQFLDSNRYAYNWDYATKSYTGANYTAQALVATNFKEFVDSLIVDGLQRTDHLTKDIHIFPAYYKYVAEQMQEIDITSVKKTSLSGFLASLAWLCHYYEDPSVLTHLPPGAFNALSPVTAYQYNRSDWVGIAVWKQLFKDSLFASFERSKQYRIIASCMADAASVRLAADAISMIKQCTDKGEKTVDHIDSRDVKNIKDYHDKVVQVYNSIKYKPVPIPTEFTDWITDYGVEIPDTNIKIVIPENTNTIRNWGTTQGHCIGTYADQAVTGQNMLLGVWSEETNDWIGHLMMRSFQLIHAAIGGIGGQARHRYGSTNAEENLPAPVIKGEVNQEAAINSIRNTTMQNYISQFYGKHNSVVDETVKQAVYNHLSLAFKEKLKNLYIEKDKGDTLVREQEQATV